MSNEMLGAICIVLGGFSVILGIKSYTGKWRYWAPQYSYKKNAGPSMLPIGLGFMMMGILLVAKEALRPVFFPLSLVAFALQMLGLIGIYWMPRALLPKWYVKERDEFRNSRR